MVSKSYSIDLLVEGGALFEIKAVDHLHDRHRAQLLNYLLLGDVATTPRYGCPSFSVGRSGRPL